MYNNYDKVLEFNKMLSLSEIDVSKRNLRLGLIKEEYEELLTAHSINDRNETIDAICDLLYVVYGTLIEFNMKSFINNHENYLNIIECDKYLFLYDVLNIEYYNKCNEIELLNEIYNLYQKLEIDINETDLNKLLFICYKLGNILDINVDKFFSIVHDSNMTKFPDDLNIVNKTIDKYKEKKIEADYKYNSELQRYIIYNKDTGKILKPLNWKAPILVGL